MIRPLQSLHVASERKQTGGNAMGFFGKLLGKSDEVPSIPANARPISAAAPRQIGYDPKLIDSLLHDHAQLGQIFTRIGEAPKTGNFSEVCALLVQFKSRLEAHILTENVRFYTYLQQSLANDLENARMMTDFRREMNVIARGVIDFVKQYQSCGFAPDERMQFANDYATVGKLLEQRLDSEENSLYPLYQPN